MVHDGPGRGSAVFVLPTVPGGRQGPVASWISTAGWASAAKRVLGNAWVVTPFGLIDVEELRTRAAARGPAVPNTTWRRRIPVIAKTFAKDARDWRRAREFKIDPHGPWSGTDIAFVWQRHELFHTAGLRLAHTFGVPSVLFVPATVVWQAEQWSVRRPVWGRWLERAVEAPTLHDADVVACGSDLVAEQVLRMGVAEDRVLITPTGVDVRQFETAADRLATRNALGLDGRFVVGWVGSFRGFHGLEQLVDAAAACPGTSLLLVGDGPERTAIERRTHERSVNAVFTGTVPHRDVAGLLNAMDAGVLLGAPGQPFHYSPLKLAEYLAAGMSVVAPDFPAISSRLTDGEAALLVEPYDVGALADAFRSLAADEQLRARLRAGARATAAAWSWDEQVRRVYDAVLKCDSR